MNGHSSSIALAMIIAFAIFIVWRGDLPKFLGILGIGGVDVTSNSCNQSGGLVSSVVSAVSNATSGGTQPLPSTGPV